MSDLIRKKLALHSASERIKNIEKDVKIRRDSVKIQLVYRGFLNGLLTLKDTQAERYWKLVTKKRIAFS